ncbi:MAG: YidC/Oxa1 family membrane protein insertase [Alistipes shahii]
MFRFFPASIELREQPFLWADDLSSYDSIVNLPFSIPFYGDHVSLFALLMAVSLFGYSWFNYQQTASSQPQMAGMKFMMVYMMPIMMLFWFNSYSSGLCYYYLLSNIFTIGQTLVIRRMVDDNKIHADHAGERREEVERQEIEIPAALRGADASAGGPAAREEKIGGTPL